MLDKFDTPQNPAALEENMTVLSVAFDSIRLLTPSRFETLFEPVREQFEAHQQPDDHSDIPMLAVPIGVDKVAKRITTVGDPVKYWSTEKGDHITLGEDHHRELIAENEVVLYLDCRARAPTPRHFRAVLLTDLANQKRRATVQYTNLNPLERICDVCGMDPGVLLGSIIVRMYPGNSDELSGFDVVFCFECEEEILELFSSFESMNRPDSTVASAEVFMQQSECSFCGDRIEDGSTRAGVEFSEPVSEEDQSTNAMDDGLYTFCPDCCSVFRTFLENLGLSLNKT